MKITCLTKIEEINHPEFGPVHSWKGELENGHLCMIKWCKQYASFGTGEREMFLHESLKVIRDANKKEVIFQFPDIQAITKHLGHEITEKYSE